MNMSSNLSYTQTGDYLLPNLTLHQPKTPLGKYGRMRLSFLRQQRPVLYNTMLLNGSLYPTLTELEQTAAAMKKQLMADLLAKNPAPGKEKNQMAWVQHMNSLQEQVEEVIRTELMPVMQVTKGMTITVRYFKEDTAHPEIPAVSNYVTLTGKADRIDPVFRTLQVGDTVVPFEDLVEVSGEGIMEIDQYLGISEE